MRVSSAVLLLAAVLVILGVPSQCSIPKPSALSRGEVLEENLGDRSVSSAKLQQYIVGSEHIRNRAVRAEHIAVNSIQEQHFQSRSVTAKSTAIETVIILLRGETWYSSRQVGMGNVATPEPRTSGGMANPLAAPGTFGVNAAGYVMLSNRLTLKPMLAAANLARVANHHVAQAEFWEAHGRATGPGIILGWYPSLNGHLLRYQADRALRTIECAGVVTENIVVQKYDSTIGNAANTASREGGRTFDFTYSQGADDDGTADDQFITAGSIMVEDPGGQDMTFIEPLYYDTLFELRCGPTTQQSNVLDGSAGGALLGEDNVRCAANSVEFPRRWVRYDTTGPGLARAAMLPRMRNVFTEQHDDPTTRMVQDTTAGANHATATGSRDNVALEAFTMNLAQMITKRPPANINGAGEDLRGVYSGTGAPHGHSPPERCSLYTNVGDLRASRYNEMFTTIPGPAEGTPVYSPTIERIAIDARGLITVRYAGRGLPGSVQPDVAISVVVLLNNKIGNAVGNIDGPA